MNLSDVRFHPLAADEAAEAYGWYRERSPGAATAFRAQLARAVSLIAEAPDRHQPCLHGTRRILVARFPYLVV